MKSRRRNGKRVNRLPAKTALLLIDVQKGFDEPVWGRRNNAMAEERMRELLDAWRKTKRPVYHVRHMSVHPKSPLFPGREGNEIKEIVRPERGEPVIEKNVNSAFIGTDLESRLRRAGIDTLVIAGLTTDHCVSTTARMGGNLGFKCYVVGDATATFERVGPDGTKYGPDEMHNTALASIHREFATVAYTKQLIEWLRNT